MEDTKKIAFYVRALIAVCFLLTVLGVVFIYSSSSVFALEKYGSDYYFLKRQIIYLFLACIGFVVCSQVPLKVMQDNVPFFFLGSFVLTLMTYFPAFSRKMHGSSRWLSLFGLSFQPSEFLIMMTIFLVARFLAQRSSQVSFKDQLKIPFVIMLGLSFLILLRQPDFGAVVTLFATLCVLIYIEELAFKHIAMIVGATIPVVGLLVFAQPYRIQRILNFLDPWRDPQGKGFQIIQSLIAIGSGEWWGLGISHSCQKFFYLPMQHTDFIFSIIAEETGFIGCCLLIMLFMAFCYYGFALAIRLSNRFAFFSVLGFVVLINVRATINLMVATGLLPTKGLGLPFISYGGTAIIALYCMLGFILNAAHEQMARRDT